jgi:hypothetical protein
MCYAHLARAKQGLTLSIHFLEDGKNVEVTNANKQRYIGESMKN